MTASIKTIFGTTAAILLSTALTGYTAELSAPAGKTNDEVFEIELPPPFVTEIDAGGFSATTYSLTGPDTVEQFQVRISTPGKFDMVIYDFKNEKARYFIFHTNNGETELTPIAIKPFWDVDPVELAHARIMGCKAALEMGMGERNPYSETSKQYLKGYCPHP